MATPYRVATVLALYPLMMSAQAPVPEVSIRTHAYAPPSTILRAEANLVETGLTVRDREGNTVAGLHASDFEVLDNDVSQPITGFSEHRPDKPPAEPGVALYL